MASGSRERMEMKHSKEELSEIVNRLVGRSEKCKNRMKALAESAIVLMAERGVSPAEFRGSSRSFVFNFQRYAAGEFREPSATMYKAAEDIDAWYGKTADARVKDAATELMPILKEMCELYDNSLSLEKQLAAYEAVCDAVRIMEDMRGLHEEIEQREELLQGHYQVLYNGILSNWDSIREALDWAVRLKALLSDAPVSDDFVKSVCRGGDFIRLCEQAKDKIWDRRKEMAADYSWFIAQFDQPESFDSVSLTALYDLPVSMRENFP